MPTNIAADDCLRDTLVNTMLTGFRIISGQKIDSIGKGGDMLKFGERTARLLDDAYLGSDFVQRRLANRRILDPQTGERIVDIGCGNGLMTAELARAVGESGMVFGIDPSGDMRKSAEGSCGNFSNVEIVDGVADRLPLEDGDADKAVSVQVFEYLEDIPSALSEAYRVLKPGGRLVVGDMHFGTLAWYSDRPERMEKMRKAWDRHFVEGAVPAILPGLMREAGFRFETAVPFTILDSSFRSDGIARMMTILMSEFAIQNDIVSEAEARDWVDEQENLAKAGRFHFVFTHIVTSAIKPG